MLSATAEAGRTERQLLNVDGSNDISDLRLVLGEGRTISGTVSGLLAGERQNTHVDLEGAEGVAEIAAVDESGSYSVHGLPPGLYTIVATTSLDRLMSKQVALSKDNDEIVDFVFPQGNRVSGRITRSRKPVPFVTVNAVPADGQTVSGSGESSQSGQYTIDGLERGSYLITPVGRGRTATVFVSGDTELDISLPESSISGRVTDAHRAEPVSRAHVVLSLEESGSTVLKGEAVSDADGEFLVPDLDAGAYQLSVYKAGYELVTQSVAISGPTASHEISLTPSEGIEFRLTDGTTGRPIRHAYVVQSSGSGTGVSFDIALDDGIGRLPQSLSGRDLLVSAPGYAPVSIQSWNGAFLSLRLVPVAE